MLNSLENSTRPWQRPKPSLTALFTKLPDCLPPYRMVSGGRSCHWLPFTPNGTFFSGRMEWWNSTRQTQEAMRPAALWIALLAHTSPREIGLQVWCLRGRSPCPISGGWRVTLQVWCLRGGTLPCDLSHDAFDVTYHPQTDTFENITFPNLRLRAVVYLDLMTNKN